MHFKKALVQNTSWKIGSLFLLFFINVFMARILGVEKSGHFFYYVSIFTLLGTFLRFGIESGVVYVASKYKNATGALFFLLFPICVLQTALVYFFLHLFELQTRTYGQMAIVLFVMANIFLYYVTAFFQARRNFITVNVVNAFVSAAQLGCFVFIFLQQKRPFIQNQDITKMVFVVLTGSSVLQVLFLISYFRVKYKYYFKKIWFSQKLFQKLFSYSGLNFLNGVLFFLIGRADFYFVEKFCSAYELGNYVQAAKVGQMLLVLPNMLGGVVFAFAINSTNLFEEKICFLCRTLSSLFLMLLLAICIFGKFLFVLFFGAGFNLVFYIVLLLLPGVFFMSINLVLLSYFEGKNKQLIILASACFSLLLIILGDSVFVPAYHYFAAAIVFSVANTLGAFLLINYFLKNIKLKMSDLFILKISDAKVFQSFVMNLRK